MARKRKTYKINPFIIIFFSIIFLTSAAYAELKLEAVYPTLGVMGQNLDVTLIGTEFDANTRVSMYLDSGNKRAIVGSVETPHYAHGVTVSGSYAYVADYE